jgi:hypothetical protein
VAYQGINMSEHGASIRTYVEIITVRSHELDKIVKMGEGGWWRVDLRPFEHIVEVEKFESDILWPEIRPEKTEYKIVRHAAA